MTAPFHAIYFDCDSTLATIEGIDELAHTASDAVRSQIVSLTDAAMDGRMAVDEVYGERLDLIRPTRDAVGAIGDAYIANMVEDTATVVAALTALGKRVGIVSGGLLPAVLRLAQHLGVDPERVHAVDLSFGTDGSYQDFDRASPLARNGGKPEVLTGVPAEDRPIAFVGDGITDLEAAPVVDRFIGFGGVARRERVAAEAEFFAAGPSLADVLQFCTTSDERRSLAEDSRFAELIQKA